MAGLRNPRALGEGVNATWTYTLGSIVFFFVVIDALIVLELLERFTASRAPIDFALVVLVVAASAVQIRYCWFLRVGTAGGLPRAGWTIALFAPAVAAWALAFLLPEQSRIAVIPLWLACGLLACLIHAPWRWLLLTVSAGISLAPLAFSALTGASPEEQLGGSRLWMALVYAAVMPFILLSSMWWWQVVRRLDESRLVAAELAVTQERLRFAADLHDIQGHHLQVIALKAELAERLLAQDPAAAAEHLHEVRLIAKQAMEETRSLVAGLREVALDDELENAREVLSLAGAACTLDLDSLPDDARVHRALALSVREATTNILRHSDATEASITLHCTGDGCTLVIGNNGLPTVAPAGGDTAQSARPHERLPGSGIAGLRQRIEALGGTLETCLDSEADRFELRVWVPTAGSARPLAARTALAGERK